MFFLTKAKTQDLNIQLASQLSIYNVPFLHVFFLNMCICVHFYGCNIYFFDPEQRNLTRALNNHASLVIKLCLRPLKGASVLIN